MHGLPPVEKAPNWKGKLLIFTVRCSSRSLRWRISPMSKPNSCLSLKFTQIHKGKKLWLQPTVLRGPYSAFPSLLPFSSKCQEPHVVTLGFSSFEGRERQLKSASSHGLRFGVGQVYTAVTADAAAGTTGAPCTGASLGCKPDPHGTGTIAGRLLRYPN